MSQNCDLALVVYKSRWVLKHSINEISHDINNLTSDVEAYVTEVLSEVLSEGGPTEEDVQKGDVVFFLRPDTRECRAMLVDEVDRHHLSVIDPFWSAPSVQRLEKTSRGISWIPRKESGTIYIAGEGGGWISALQWGESPEWVVASMSFASNQPSLVMLRKKDKDTTWTAEAPEEVHAVSEMSLKDKVVEAMAACTAARLRSHFVNAMFAKLYSHSPNVERIYETVQEQADARKRVFETMESEWAPAFRSDLVQLEATNTVVEQRLSKFQQVLDAVGIAHASDDIDASPHVKRRLIRS